MEKDKNLIPKNTIYCDGCPYYENVGVKYICRDINNPPDHEHDWETCPSSAGCTKTCWETPFSSCKSRIVRCNYMNYTDYDENSLLWDGCKECGINEDETKEN